MQRSIRRTANGGRSQASFFLLLIIVAVAGAYLAFGAADAAGLGSAPVAAVPFPSKGVATAATPCGDWNIVNSPDPVADDNFLFGMEVVSSDDIWAVGHYVVNPAPEYEHSLAMHWNGSQWQVVPSPNPSSEHNWLYDASAVAPDDMWAVGSWFNQGVTEMLGMHWNGSQWSLTTMPGPGQLNAVSAVASDDAWAVGSYLEGSTYRARIVHWDGGQWTVVSAPDTGPEASFLFSVKAISADDVWAVGRKGNHPNYQSLILHWNGTEWSIVPHPKVIELWSVDALSAADVWAVGGTKTLHWNGAEWSDVPITLSADSTLQGVTAISPNEVWAAGYYVGGTGTQTLLRYWDGSSWNEVPGFNADNFNVLTAIDSASSSDVWAVGHSSPGGGSPYSTMTGRFVPGTGCATPTYTRTPTQATTTHTRTATATPTRTGTATATMTPCTMTFSDVHPADYFYERVRALYCMGAISGYADNTFRPYNYTTRGQLSKIIALAEGWAIQTPGTPAFSDVPAGHPFYGYIETAYSMGVVSGYADGTFRPGNEVTRGQLSKITSLAEGWPPASGGTPIFSDVPIDHPFYAYVEAAFSMGVISGYADGTFRPGNSATRGQISKIVHGAITLP